jgi:hypothetical protein
MSGRGGSTRPLRAGSVRRNVARERTLRCARAIFFVAGVIGRKAASVSNFDYSGAMKTSNRTWDAQSVESFITAPKEFVPGTRMELPGVPDPDVRRAIIDFLSTAK